MLIHPPPRCRRSVHVSPTISTLTVVASKPNTQHLVRSANRALPVFLFEQVYEIVGNLFFASSETFLSLFDHRNDPAMVEVHLHTADIEDFSAMQTLTTLGERYTNAGKRLRLRRVKKESMRVIS